MQQQEALLGSLQRAIEIALEAHKTQTDKAGALYILHPLRVMLAQDSDDARIVGALHDVVEDCEGWSFDRLRGEGFSETVIEALQSVTKRPKGAEEYPAFIARAALNLIGRAVKLADLYDNCDLSRIARPTVEDEARVAKYCRAIAQLDGTLPR